MSNYKTHRDKATEFNKDKREALEALQGFNFSGQKSSKTY